MLLQRYRVPIQRENHRSLEPLLERLSQSHHKLSQPGLQGKAAQGEHAAPPLEVRVQEAGVRPLLAQVPDTVFG